MYNSIQFKDGRNVWITEDEKSVISHNLLNGDKFIELGRLGKIYNADTISEVGIPAFMSTIPANNEGPLFSKEGWAFTKAMERFYKSNTQSWFEVSYAEYADNMSWAEVIA